MERVEKCLFLSTQGGGVKNGKILSTELLNAPNFVVKKDFFGTVVNLFTGGSGGSNGGGGGVGDLIAHPHSILQQPCNSSAAAAAAAQAAACTAQAAAQYHDRLKLFKI